jgi:AhpD family alkylhydroperoxidase
MNHLSLLERELVALGAAMGSNCASCVAHHVPVAQRAGLTAEQIEEAVELADAIRQVSARNALAAASEALVDKPAGDTHPAEAKPCKQPGQHARGCC